MSKRNKPANAGSGKPAADTSPDQQTDPAIGAATPDGQAPAPADGGSGGGDGAAGQAPEVVKAPFDPALVAMYAAQQLRCPVPVNPEKWQDEVVAFTELAAFFRTFPDSPDQAGLVQLQRKGVELPAEGRPGELIAMIRLFRCALDQLDQLDREDAARAEAAKPKPAPEVWREPKGYKQTKQAMKPGSGLKPRR
jgi:hypothetical protein